MARKLIRVALGATPSLLSRRPIVRRVRAV
jgi:hypothetical protein